MRPIFFAILLTLVSTPAFAATTWSSLDSQGFVRKAVCTTGTEAAPTLAAEGLSTASLVSVVVVVESGSAFGTGARLNAYTWNQFSAAWSRQPESDIELDATLEAQTIGPLNPGPVGRLVFAPSGLAAASTITLIGSPSAEGVRPQALDAYGRVYTRVVGADGGVPEVRGTVVVTSPDGGLPEVGLGDLLTALAPGYVAIVDALGNQIGIAAAPLASEPIVDGAAVGAANPLPTVPTDALHPAELTVSTSCLFLALPSASALTPTAGQRYRLMARNDYVCAKSGSAPVSCEGVPMFAPDAPEAVAFTAGDLYFFTPGTSAGIELCPLVEQ